MSATLMNPPLAKTPLHDWHVSRRGRMVEFGGWSMPVQYESIVAEHEAVRKAVGLFDISHMGRLTFSGAGATEFLDSLLTRQVDDMQSGQIRYSLLTNDAGGIRDDVLLYRLQESHAGDGDAPYLLVVNASNRQKILDWIAVHIEGYDAACSDETFGTAMIAVQGPAARKLVAQVLESDLSAMRYYHGAKFGAIGDRNIVSRTGYTGEDGFELIVPAAVAMGLWEKLLSAGKQYGAMPVGLGARDTLRLEAAMPLYGHELSESIDPFTAGLDFAVNLQNRNFPGHDALARIASRPRDRVRIGLELMGKRVPREGYSIRRTLREADDAAIGEVSSGTFSPTLKRPIAMGYVEADAAKPGAELVIDIRGQLESARIVPLPFYRRPKTS